MVGTLSETKMRLRAIVIIGSIIAFATCAFIAFFLLQERGEDLFRDEVNDDYAMKFAFQYGGGGAYYVKVDDNLFIWACRGPVEGYNVAEEDFANPELNWRSAQITQDDFDYLVSLVKETPLRSEGSFSDDFVVLGAWTITVFYDPYIARGVSHACRFWRLSDKLVELSPIRVDLTVRGGS